MFFTSVNLIPLESMIIFHAISLLFNAQPHLNILLFTVWYAYYSHDVMDVGKHNVVRILVTVILRYLGR